jgi:putative endonuclease
MRYVYTLKCADASFYVGCTCDINRGILDHNSHKVHYTKDKTPVELRTYIAFNDKYRAFEFEKYLKSGSGIAFRNKHIFKTFVLLYPPLLSLTTSDYVKIEWIPTEQLLTNSNSVGADASFYVNLKTLRNCHFSLS